MLPRSLACVSFLALGAPFAGAQGAASLFTDGHPAIGSGRIEAVIDLNDDGILDLAGWWWTSGMSKILTRAVRLDGLGRWTMISGSSSETIPFGAEDSHATAVHDFDRDGNPDMAVVLRQQVQVFEHLGNTFYHRETVLPTIALGAIGPRAIVFGDFDLDGDDDLIVASTTEAQLLLCSDGPHFTPGPSVALGGGDAVDLVVGEFNGDGRVDLAALTGTPAGWTLQVFPIASAQFFPPTTETFALDGPVAVTAGDIDGDLDLDVCVFGVDRYRVLRRTEPAAFSFEPGVLGGPATDLVDIDADGDLDGVCCGGGGGGGGPYNDEPSNFEICLNDGTGAFDQSVSFASVGAHHIAGALDYDGDGDLDLFGGRSVLVNHTVVGVNFCEATRTSTGSPAHIFADGSASIGRDDLVLRASDAPAQTFGHFFMGDWYQETPLSAGFLCTNGPHHRFAVVSSDASGVFEMPLDYASLPTAAALEPGDVRGFQLWFRDPQAGNSNLTEGLQIVFTH